MREIEREIAPLEAAHDDALRLDPALFARIDAVHEARHDRGLDDEAVRLVERYHLDFVLAGARLDEPGRARLTELNQELSELSTTFGQNLQLASEAAAVRVADAAELDGLGDEEIAAAATAAADRGLDGYVLPLLLPTGQPVLAQAPQPGPAPPGVRGVGRAGRRPGSTTTGRSPRASPRCGPSAPGCSASTPTPTSSWPTPPRGRPAAVDEMLASMVPASVANAEAEADDPARGRGRGTASSSRPGTGRSTASRCGPSGTPSTPPRCGRGSSWTGCWSTASSAPRSCSTATGSARDPTSTATTPTSGSGRSRDADGAPVGLYLGDFYAREGKRGGAWMSSFVRQSRLLGTSPVVVNNLNVSRAAAGQPTLLTLDEVNTLFHEFGHALHGLSSAVTYPRFSGTSVPRDFVEFPSQVNEMWALWPEILGHYARHVETGEPLASSVVEAIDAAEAVGRGLRHAGVPGRHPARPGLAPDHARHRDRRPDRVRAAGAARTPASPSELVLPRYRTTYFQHIFAGGYAAGYYSYIWSEVLDADTVEWFKENGGLRRENGDVFRTELLSVGGSIDPLAAFRAVRGRDADPMPLLRRRGLDEGLTRGLIARVPRAVPMLQHPRCGKNTRNA